MVFWGWGFHFWHYFGDQRPLYTNNSNIINENRLVSAVSHYITSPWVALCNEVYCTLQIFSYILCQICVALMPMVPVKVCLGLAYVISFQEAARHRRRNTQSVAMKISLTHKRRSTALTDIKITLEQQLSLMSVFDIDNDFDEESTTLI